MLTLYHDIRLVQSSSPAKKVTAYIVYFELHKCICILFICHTDKIIIRTKNESNGEETINKQTTFDIVSDVGTTSQYPLSTDQ